MTDYNKLNKDITEWLKYNILIDKLNNKTKLIKEHKNNLENTILSFIKDNYLVEKKLKISNYHIFYNTSNSLPPISFKLIETVLSDTLSPELKSIIINKIKIVRENNTTESISLKKKKIKQSKQSKILNH